MKRKVKREEVDIPLWQVFAPWIAAATIIVTAIVTKADTPPLGTNEFRKVAWVNERGEVNVPEVIATVAQQTTNETKVLVAAEAARSAASAASTATNAVKNVVAQMAANDVHIYREGNLVSFEALINWDPERDILAICEFSSSDTHRTQQHFGYIASQDIGTTKPRILASDTLTVPVADWEPLPDSSVSPVTIHDEEKDYGCVKYKKWYSVEAEDEPDNQHFYSVSMSIDNPEGDGMTLNISGGFTDGVTQTFVDGSLRKTYKGGILVGVENVE